MSKLENLMGQLPECACALICDDINRRYFTGMKSSAGTLAVFRECAYLIIDFRYIEKARESVRDCEVILQEKLYDQLCGLMEKHKPEKILVESDRTTLSAFDSLKKGMGDLGKRLSGENTLSRIIGEMRSVKTNEELRLITNAQRIAEGAFEDILEFIKPGVTEREIALRLNDTMLRAGAEDISFETIALSGVNTSMPHGVPSEKPVERGEFVLMDFGAVCQGYHSDMTRTVAVGQLSEEMERIYGIVLAAQLAAIDIASAGITGKELDSTAREYISKEGFGEAFGHGLGHSVGLEIHESPCANTRDGTVLRENMVMTIEPGIYLPKKFGVRIEDFVAITPNSCRNLTNAPKNLIKL